MSTLQKNDDTLYKEINDDVNVFVDDGKELNSKVMTDLRNLCHYSCSKINLTNILLVVVIIILIVLLFRK